MSNFSRLLLACTLLASAANVSAASGDLDTTFHSPYGYAMKAFDLGGNDSDMVQLVLIQSNGDIVLVGSIATGTSSFDIALTRLLPDGTLDTSFGSGGSTYVSVPALPVAGVSAAALDPTDGIYVTGYQGYLAHFTSSGALDTAFASSGFYFMPTSGTYHPEDIAVDRSGMPVIVGSNTSNQLFVIRLTTSAQLDPAFNGGQPFIKTIGTGSGPIDSAWSVTFDSVGRIYLGAEAGTGGTTTQTEYPAMVRLTANGQIDTACNGSGVVLFTGFSSFSLTPMSILFRDTHHVILTGSVANGAGQLFAFDFDADNCTAGTGPGMIANGASKYSGRAVVASDGTVYVSAGIAGESTVLALHNGLPYNGQPFTIYPSTVSAGAGIVLSAGRPLQAIQQQVSGSNYDFAVARFQNDRIFYANFDRDAPN